MKKIISMILALMMILSLATVAFATEGGSVRTGTPETGSITIAGIALDDDGDPVATYKVYKLLDIDGLSHNTATNVTSISYVATNDIWRAFFEASINYNVDDVTGVVTLIGNPDTTTVAKATAAAAKNKIDELNGDSDPSNNITPVCTSACDTAGHVVVTDKDNNLGDLKFDNLPLGYYLIESDMGILCGIDTTSPDGLVNAKNAPPTIDKQVKEDSNDGLNDTNHADIGQLVSFEITVTAQAGAENYVVHDIMSEGLDFLPNTLTVERQISAENYRAVDVNKGTDYTISVPGNSCKDGCTFEVVFDNSFLSTVGTSDKLVIRYDTKLNDHAIISGEGNSNEAYISYGNNFTTEHDKTTTYTYLFDIVKIDGYTKGLLDGAEFALSYKNNILDEDGQVIEADVIPLVYMDEISEESGIPTYHIANGNMTDEHEPVDRIVATGGKARIVGLDAAVYYLTETQAPAGFNKLSSSHQVAVDDQHNWVAYGEDGQPAENSGVIIENNSGTELPSTGAKGTAMFISFGMFMVICTGLLLVTKKRMSMIQE